MRLRPRPSARNRRADRRAVRRCRRRAGAPWLPLPTPGGMLTSSHSLVSTRPSPRAAGTRPAADLAAAVALAAGTREDHVAAAAANAAHASAAWARHRTERHLARAVAAGAGLEADEVHAARGALHRLLEAHARGLLQVLAGRRVGQGLSVLENVVEAHRLDAHVAPRSRSPRSRPRPGAPPGRRRARRSRTPTAAADRPGSRRPAAASR